MRTRAAGALASVACLAGLAAPSSSVAQSPPTQDENCVVCHSVLGVERLSSPAKAFAQDIHAVRGLGCVSCHGGDATAVGVTGMDPAKGFLGRPEPQEIPGFCGRCHANAEFMRQYNPSLRVDQVAEYASSVHGRRLLELGDSLVATCISCHPAHAIKPPSDPQASVHPLNVARTCGACHADAERMQAYRSPTDQLERYERSVHWQMLSVRGDLSAPTCNDCHGNHGAAPPGISWVGNVCGQCHSVMAENFSQSRHAQTFTLLGVPGCATCHQNHEVTEASDEMLGLGEGAVCARCHSAADAAGQVAAAMRSLVDSLSTAQAMADSVLQRAERAGMEISQARFDLGSANNAAIQARAAMHAFNIGALKEHIDTGLAIVAVAHQHGQEAMANLRFRRLGLAISSVIIVLLIVGLLLKIRQIEGAAPTTEP